MEAPSQPPAAAKPTCPEVPVFTSRDGKTYVVAFSNRNVYSGTVAMTIYTATSTYAANLPIAVALPTHDAGYRSLPFAIANPGSDPFVAAEITFVGTQGAGGCVARVLITPYSNANVDERAAYAAVDPARPPVTLLKVIGENSALTCKTPYAPAEIDGYAAQLAYPDMARELGQTGTTLVKVTLAADGTVVAEAIYASSGSSLLDRSALNAAAATHYRASIFRCEPISGSFIFKAEFSVGR
jgi:TonB family protein